MKHIFQITILDNKTVEYWRKLKDLCKAHNINYSNAHYSVSRTKKEWYEIDNFIIQKHLVK